MLTATGRRWRTTPPPYPIPSAAPYNVPTYLVTPTEDGSGSTVHPCVVDMGPSRWRGWRFWMAVTGYWQSDDDYENPHILVSQDGVEWQPPTGLTNPVYKTTGFVFHSDTHLTYDPSTDRMWLFFRRLIPNAEAWEYGRQQIFYASSADGVTWPAAATALNWTRPYGDGQVLSPAIVRRGPGDWWLFGYYHSTREMVIYRATAPDGAWTGPTWAVGRANAGGNPWHLDVIDDGGVFRAICDLGPKYLGGSDGLVAGSSRDGLNWTWAPTQLMELSAAPAWDSGELYRTTFAPHEDGMHYRVWYSANGPDSWRTGFTVIPKSAWPSI